MKMPYQLVKAVSDDQRHAHMAHAVSLGLPRLTQIPIDPGRTLHVACYGPSLADTWCDLRHPLISMSGATRWLAERGMVADYHVNYDPRPQKVMDVDPPVPGVQYLMASCSDPAVFGALSGAPVTLWHAYSCEETPVWVARYDPGQLLVWGASTVGLAALHLGGVMGYQRFEIHGMDGSFRDGQIRHAGPHSDLKPQRDDITWDAGGRTYRTSTIMANAVADTINALRLYPMLCIFHGDGLTQALVREQALDNACCADEADKATVIRRAAVNVVQVPEFDPKRTTSFWDALMSTVDPAWVAELQTERRVTDARRATARYNTGSVTLETALLLRALSAWAKPTTVVEVGTFTGYSAAALLSPTVTTLHTCDRDNDCLPSTPRLVCYPYILGGELFRRLSVAGTIADLVFLDGRLVAADVPSLLAITGPRTLYALDDYHPGGKGLANAELLAPALPRHAFAPPHAAFGDRTTLAAFVPMGI